MKMVWRELLRRRRTDQTITTYVNSRIDRQGAIIDETHFQHASLQGLLVTVVWQVLDPLRLGEMAPSHPKWSEWEEAAARLREDAAEVLSLGKDALADRLLGAATAYDDLVGTPTPYERKGKKAEARTLTLLVATHLTDLFGSPLYRTTATTAAKTRRATSTALENA
jgi:hypothetical protein